MKFRSRQTSFLPRPRQMANLNPKQTSIELLPRRRLKEKLLPQQEVGGIKSSHSFRNEIFLGRGKRPATSRKLQGSAELVRSPI